MGFPRLGRFTKFVVVFSASVLLIVFGLYFWWLWRDRPRIARLQRCIDREVPAWREKLRTGGVELGEPEFYIDPMDPRESAILRFLSEGKPVAHRALRVRTEGEYDGTDEVCEAKEALVED